jgi:hypothetical protein
MLQDLALLLSSGNLFLYTEKCVYFYINDSNHDQICNPLINNPVCYLPTLMIYSSGADSQNVVHICDKWTSTSHIVQYPE